VSAPGKHIAVPRDEVVRERMRGQRERNTGIEMRLRSTLHRRGLRFRVHRRLLKGSRREADIVFPGARVAVFVDGCFWHGCPEHGTWPRNNRAFWRAKIRANIRRDRDTDNRLRAEGWRVIRVWEHDSTDVAADDIVQVVRGVDRVSA
jgi:DNA mismatch endonuclease, patch repair protein